MRDLSGRTLLEQVDDLSSAEDFFLFFLLPFDQKVLNVCRLHILRRMGEYLAETDFGEMRDDDIFLAARAHLKQAYLDFVESSPLAEGVFKVFADQQRAQAGRFVAIDSLTVAAD